MHSFCLVRSAFHAMGWGWVVKKTSTLVRLHVFQDQSYKSRSVCLFAMPAQGLWPSVQEQAAPSTHRQGRILTTSLGLYPSMQTAQLSKSDSVSCNRRTRRADLSICPEQTLSSTKGELARSQPLSSVTDFLINNPPTGLAPTLPNFTCCFHAEGFCEGNSIPMWHS